MKKKKLNILLNIATICLCVCAIAIGVYSVKNASLSVTGTVNFKAHDCLVQVDVSMYGDAVDTNNTPDKAGTPRASASARKLGTWDNSQSDAGTTLATVTGSTGEVANQCYFSDMGTSGEVEDIVLEFKVTNNSDFPVTASIRNVTGDNYKFSNANGMNFSGDAIIASLPAKDTTASTATLQLKLNIKDISKAPGDYTVSLYFERTKETSLTVQTGEFYYDADATAGQSKSYSLSDLTTNPVKAQRNYVTMGTYNGTDLKWYIFAQSDSKTGAMKAVTGTVANEDGTLPKGTYWFISEYALGSQVFDEGYEQTYEGSDIQKFITDETTATGTFFATYGITASTDPVYSQIAGRIINDKASPNVSTDYEDECKTKASKKLWLLSEDELDLLNGGESVTSYYEGVYTSTYYKNILALNGDTSSSLASWWLRSPRADDSDYAFLVKSFGDIDYYTVYDDLRVRAAFQITI